MSFVYIDRPHCRLKSYGATTKGGKSVLRIEIEVSDPFELGMMLRELGKIDQEQRQPPVKPKQLLLPGPSDGTAR